ncbi:UNVERIFIED_CONTAM: hypothetical protein RKD50_009478 [Streptomyces canus]
MQVPGSSSADDLVAGFLSGELSSGGSARTSVPTWRQPGTGGQLMTRPGTSPPLERTAHVALCSLRRADTARTATCSRTSRSRLVDKGTAVRRRGGRRALSRLLELDRPVGWQSPTSRRRATRRSGTPSVRSVANIVENAVKYNPPGEKVPVAASAIADRVVDRAPPSPTRPRTASSRTSSATATPRAARASASDSRSPEASPRPSAARTKPRTHRAPSPWCSPYGQHRSGDPTRRTRLRRYRTLPIRPTRRQPVDLRGGSRTDRRNR